MAQKIPGDVPIVQEPVTTPSDTVTKGQGTTLSPTTTEMQQTSVEEQAESDTNL